MSTNSNSPVSAVRSDTESDARSGSDDSGNVVGFPPRQPDRPAIGQGRPLRGVRRSGLLLNKQTVKRLSCPPGKAEHLYRDSQLIGFLLRCYANGRRIWTTQFRDSDGKTRRVTIGDAAAIDAGVARARARTLLANKGAAAERDQARKALRFGQAVDQYLEFVSQRHKPSTLKATTQALKVTAAKLHALTLRSLTRANIAELHRDVSKRHGAVMANRVLAQLSALFGWAISIGLLEQNPAFKVPRNVERKRKRVLSDDELKRIWAATDDGSDFSRIVRLLLLTGCRRGEVGSMAWGELDDSDGSLRLSEASTTIWTVPAERTKNGEPHEVPLASLALAQLPERRERPFVFGRDVHAGYGGWSKGKQQLDQRVKIADWTLHDLRRTFATKLADRLRVAPHVVESLLNHTSGHKRGVAGTYNRAGYAEPKREALEQWAAYITDYVIR